MVKTTIHESLLKKVFDFINSRDDKHTTDSIDLIMNFKNYPEFMIMEHVYELVRKGFIKRHDYGFSKSSYNIIQDYVPGEEMYEIEV